jgi:DNA modification methylase
VKPFTNNPRRLSKAQAERLKATMDKFGDLSGIVHDLDTDEIIGGNQRVNVKKLMAMKPTITEKFEKPRVDGTVAVGYFDINGRRFNYRAVKGWDEETRREANLVANAGGGSWDLDELANLDPGFLRAIGFDDEMLKDSQGMVAALKALAQGTQVEGLTDPDEVPEPPKEPITKLGDLWVMGEHRLLCGDSANVGNVERLLGGQRASCVFTDPPYGVAIGAKNRFLNSFQPSGMNLTDIKDDALSPEDLKARLLPAFVNVRELVMAEDCTLFVTAPQGGGLGMMMMMMSESGLPSRHVLIWKKNAPTFSMGRLDYDYQHELILLTWGKRHKRPMAGEHRTSVWEINKPMKSEEHPTMKPVALYVNGFLNNSDKGDVVADIFAGSGTAFIAAEQTGRKCKGLEIDPAYCDVIVKRWEQFTGKTAMRNV